MTKLSKPIDKYGIHFQNTKDDELERLVVKSMLDLMENDVNFKSEFEEIKEDMDLYSDPTDDEVRDMYREYLIFLSKRRK